MGNGNSNQVDKSFYKRQAFQVIHVVKNSPADKAALLPYFDFLLQIPSSIIPYNTNYGTVKDFMMKTRQNRGIELNVFNCATGCLRTVVIQPSLYEGGDDLSGLVVRPIIINDAISEVEHVQDVIVGSPAFNVGLLPIFDYIIACDKGNCQDLHQIRNIHNPNLFLRIYVIDVLLKCSRVVDVPGLIKLGERRFGCTLVSGYLHRIPTFKMDFCVVQKPATPLVASSVASENFSLPKIVSQSSSSSQNSGRQPGSSHVTSNSDRFVDHQTNNSGDHCPSCYCHSSSVPKAKSKATKSKRHNSTGKRPSSRTSVSAANNNNANCCTFVTPMKLPGLETNRPISISVSIPKDIVTNVVADLVKYSVEQKQNNNIVNKQISNGNGVPHEELKQNSEQPQQSSADVATVNHQSLANNLEKNLTLKS